MKFPSTIKCSAVVVGTLLWCLFLCCTLSFPLTAAPSKKRSVLRAVEQDRQCSSSPRKHKGDDRISHEVSSSSRRHVLESMAASVLVLSAAPPAANALQVNAGSQELDDTALLLGKGEWKTIGNTPPNVKGNMVVPAVVATYLARILIHYDDKVAAWWSQLNVSLELVSEEERWGAQGRAFGSLASSVQLGIRDFLLDELKTGSSPNVPACYSKLGTLLLEKYSNDPEISRHVGLLLAMLPVEQQPGDILTRLSAARPSSQSGESPSQLTKIAVHDMPNPVPTDVMNDFSALLPNEYKVVPVASTSYFTISPPLSLYEVGIAEEFGQTATGTPFGPLSASPLTREVPRYSLGTYALFGISGATGCALTHSIVIPLDVVKTKAQTNPDEYTNIWQGAQQILATEGVSGLVTGAQATVAGYFWYGLSVYPSYTFFKRWIGQGLLSPQVATIHTNDIALIAGALAAVVASLGLTPLEAARIRVVADPDRYKPLGLVGTLQAIAAEDDEASGGWRTWYAGLPSLLARQVIFGSIKFLAFERACDAIYQVSPGLRDATWTALLVSLVAGGLSGCLSSIVSQPADSVLTYVARNSNLGVVEGCVQMIREEGPGSLVRGLGSRCVWAGSIIAGQFLLYDVFRTAFGVSSRDLSQVYQVVVASSS